MGGGDASVACGLVFDSELSQTDADLDDKKGLDILLLSSSLKFGSISTGLADSARLGVTSSSTVSSGVEIVAVAVTATSTILSSWLSTL
jgi:hypothetical protein